MKVDSLFEFMYDIVVANRFVRQVDINLISKEMCHDTVEKDLALVTIKMPSTFVKIQRDVTLSLPNKIGTIGEHKC